MKKRLLSLALAFVLAFSLLPATAFAAEGTLSGSGTEAEPYLIEDADDLAKVSNDLTAHYKLTENIGTETDPVMTAIDGSFTGTFDGAGYTITLDIEQSKANLGLFKTLAGGATIKNVIVTGNVSAGSNNKIGGIAGFANVYSGEISILNCKNDAAISGNKGVGGILGECSGTANALTIQGCVNTGTVTGTNNQVGGIVGNLGAKHTVSACCNRGNITGMNYVGGIVGQCAATIEWSYSTGSTKLTSSYSNQGNIYGGGKAKVNNCYQLASTSDEGVTALIGSSKFAADTEKINDGYPILPWQKTSGGGEPEPPTPSLSIQSSAGGTIWTKADGTNQTLTVLSVKYNNMDDEKLEVAWKYPQSSNAARFTEDTEKGTLTVEAKNGGVVEVTATATYDETEYSATKKITVIPDIVYVDIVNPTGGAVAQGQTVEAQVRTEGNVPYDEENFPALSYQWWYYQAGTYTTGAIKDATEKTFAIPEDYAYNRIEVEVRCGGEIVSAHDAHEIAAVESADQGKLYPVAYDQDFTLPAEIKEDTKLELPTEHTKGVIKAGIEWFGFNGVIAEDGTVTRPAAGKTEVKLTARFTYGAAYANRTFEITVWSQAAVEEEANDKRLALNNDIDAANISVLTPVFDTDTNVLTMVKNRLGREDITVMMGAPVRTNATANLSKDVVNIAADGAITYFYVDPNGEATANLQRFGTFSVPFTFERGGVTVTRTFAVTVYWDRTRVLAAMERDIVSDLPAVPSTATENFELPKAVNGKTWTDITWTSSDNAIYISTERQSSADKLLEPYVAVVRGSSVEKTVTLTAKLTFRYTNDVTGSEKPITLLRSYTVTVPASADGLKYQKALDAVFTADKLTDAATGAALNLGAVKNDIQFPTTRDLGAYMKEQYREGFDGKYTPLVITSSAPAVIAEPDVANAARVAVYRPAVGQGEETVTLTVKILDRPSGEGRNYASMPVLAEKTFRIVVKPLTREEIGAELALMAEVKAHYWDGIKNGNTAAGDVTGDLAPFVEVYKENGALVWVRDVREMKNSGIVPVAMDGWQELEAWRLFRSSNPAAVTHENLLVTQQYEGKAVTVTSALSSETLGRYGELYRKDPVKYAAYAELADLYYQTVSAELVVRGRNTANMVEKEVTVNGRPATRLVSKAVEEKVTVSFTLSGNGELWLGTRMIRDLDEGVTVFDVLRQLRDEDVLDFENKGGYVQSITCGGKTLAELDEGKNSGWLYTVNGELPDVYMSAYGLKNGDSIRIYFTKDYTKEPGADRWKPVTPVTKTETVTNADGSTTKTETKPDGTTVETTTKPDGSTTVAETKPDGSVSTVEKRADGTEIKTAQPVSGEITASVSVPKSVGSTRVDIPVSKLTGSMVAVIVHPDGTEEIVKGSVVTETGIALRAEGDMRLKIIDNAKSFNDMADHWAKDAVEFASSRELFNGVGNDAFGPDRSMTRGMVSTVLARLAGADTAGGETWYAKGTVWAVENGISDGTAPEQPVTREQLAAMLYRYAGSPAVSGELGFDDADSISAWARDAVRWCVDNGILNGVGGNRMTPQDLARRGQVAAMLMRFLQATV